MAKSERLAGFRQSEQFPEVGVKNQTNVGVKNQLNLVVERQPLVGARLNACFLQGRYLNKRGSKELPQVVL